jgi:hypothetical protein
MTICAEIKDSIGAWLDGELKGKRAETVRSHVETCAACSEERRQLARLDFAVKAVLEAEAESVGATPLWSDVRQRIEAKSSPSHGPWLERIISAFSAPSFAWAVPAVIVLLIGVLYFDLFTYMWPIGAPRNNFAIVESIDAYGRNVALLREHDSKTTVIWLYQSPDNEDEDASEAVDKGPAF